MPEVGTDEVLIRVCAAGVNPIDWKTREGGLKALRPYPMPLTLGWDVSGAIDCVGSAVTNFKVGDKVFAKLDSGRNGGYAEYVASKSSDVAHAPKNIPLEHAAGIPLACQTAWTGLFDKANLQAGQTILIHAASGGVGSFAVQLAKNAGACVIATTSAANIALVESLGADEVIDYRAEDFSQHVKGVDVVFDMLGGESRAKSWQCLKKGGVLVSVVARQDPFDAGIVKKFGVRAEPVAMIANGERLQRTAELVEAGKLKVVIAKEFPLAEAKAAHELSESGRTVGKIILRVSSSLR